MVSDGHPPSPDGSEPVIRVTSDDGATVVWLAGEHDIATAPWLRRELLAVTAVGADVVVDLSGATFIDASTVRVLSEARARMNGGSAHLVVRDPAPLPRRVLTICAVEFESTPDGGGDHGRQKAST